MKIRDTTMNLLAKLHIYLQNFSYEFLDNAKFRAKTIKERLMHRR